MKPVILYSGNDRTEAEKAQAKNPGSQIHQGDKWTPNGFVKSGSYIVLKKVK